MTVASEMEERVARAVDAVIAEHRASPKAGLQNAEAMRYAIARAILAERERCAKIADALAASAGDTCGSRDVDHVIQCAASEDMGREIASAIRSERAGE